MAKTKISEFNANPALNTDIDSINIAEGCSPSGINDAIRELMAQLKDWQSGTSNDPYVVGSSGSLTLNQGTANGVAYLNGSKVVTSGSALTFDGTNVGLTGYARSTGSGWQVLNNGLLTSYGANASGTLINNLDGGPIQFQISSSEQMRLTSTGLGIGTSSPQQKFVVSNGGAAGIEVSPSGGSQGGTYIQSYNRSGAAFVATELIASKIGFYTGTSPTFSALLDSSGNLGLGVTPSAWISAYRAIQVGQLTSIHGRTDTTVDGSFTVNGYRASSGNWTYQASDVARRYGMDGDGHKWYNAASGTAGNAITFTQAMTLDASGNLGVGVTSPSARLHVSGTSSVFSNPSGNFDLQIYQSGRYDGRISAKNSALEISQRQALPLIFLTSDTERARIDSSGNLAIGSTTANQKLHISGTGPVGIRINDTNSNNWDIINNSYLSFTRGSTETMRIDSSGNLLVGTTSNTLASRAYFLSSGGNHVIGSQVSSNGTYALGVLNASATVVGGVIANASTTSYNTSSDYRLKNSIAPMTGALAKVALLKPCTYKWNADGSDGEGFIAHELAEVCPHAVSGEKDAVNEDGSIKAQGIDTSFLVATLTAAIQELKAEFDAYKASHP